MTEAFFDLDRARIRDSDNPYERYFDVIPVLDKELLPKGASMTPTVHAKKLGELLGLPNLYLKDETAHPTGTTKYRMAARAQQNQKRREPKSEPPPPPPPPPDGMNE